MVTGFYLFGSSRAIQYTWNITELGPAYFNHDFHTGPLWNRQSWSHRDFENVGWGGQYTAYMYGGTLNYAILSNGGFCTAGYSSDSVNI